MLSLNKVQQESIIWEWNPRISVGPIYFGNPANLIINKYQLKKSDFSKDYDDWETYEFPECIAEIYIVDSFIESVCCYKQLVYNGNNLIGSSVNEIHKFLKFEYKIDCSISEQTIFDYDCLGLQLWFKDGVVIEACCFGYFSDN